MISHRVQKRLTHEVHEALALRDKRGQSKHKDKQAARKAAQDNHTAYKTITGLYATTSLTTYFCIYDFFRKRDCRIINTAFAV